MVVWNSHANSTIALDVKQLHARFIIKVRIDYVRKVINFSQIKFNYC